MPRLKNPGYFKKKYCADSNYGDGTKSHFPDRDLLVAVNKRADQLSAQKNEIARTQKNNKFKNPSFWVSVVALVFSGIALRLNFKQSADTTQQIIDAQIGQRPWLSFRSFDVRELRVDAKNGHIEADYSWSIKNFGKTPAVQARVRFSMIGKVSSNKSRDLGETALCDEIKQRWREQEPLSFTVMPDDTIRTPGEFLTADLNEKITWPTNLPVKATFIGCVVYKISPDSSEFGSESIVFNFIRTDEARMLSPSSQGTEVISVHGRAKPDVAYVPHYE